MCGELDGENDRDRRREEKQRNEGREMEMAGEPSKRESEVLSNETNAYVQ